MVESSKDDAASVSNTKNDPATWEINEIVLVAFATALIFSLSEHIVFAIQASIPVALLLISVVFALFVGRVMGELITSEPGKAIGKPYRITLTTKGWHWSRVVLLVVLGVFVERGVLFYHATSKQYRLVQWNRITEVRAKADDENW